MVMETLAVRPKQPDWLCRDATFPAELPHPLVVSCLSEVSSSAAVSCSFDVSSSSEVSCSACHPRNRPPRTQHLTRAVAGHPCSKATARETTRWSTLALQ
jgi:hypothetical protein